MSGEQLVWRASLEDPRTGERHGFASLEQLVAHLTQQTTDGRVGPDGTGGGGNGT
jgi:hypothetical protein